MTPELLETAAKRILAKLVGNATAAFESLWSTWDKVPCDAVVVTSTKGSEFYRRIRRRYRELEDE